jgi:hypothetical protein
VPATHVAAAAATSTTAATTSSSTPLTGLTTNWAVAQEGPNRARAARRRAAKLASQLQQQRWGCVGALGGCAAVACGGHCWVMLWTWTGTQF